MHDRKFQGIISSGFMFHGRMHLNQKLPKHATHTHLSSRTIILSPSRKLSSSSAKLSFLPLTIWGFSCEKTNLSEPVKSILEEIDVFKKLAIQIRVQ